MRKKKVLFVNEAHWISTGYSTYGKEVLPRIHASNKYDVAELAVYGQEGDPRAGAAPWKVYCNIPKSPDPNYDNNPAAHTGEWMFDKVCIDFEPDFVCIPTGELILTNKGYRPIESITIGDRVLTHNGKFKKVLKTFIREYDGELVVVSTADSDIPKKTTPEHPFLTNNNIYEEMVFKPAEELKVGDNLFFNPDKVNRKTREYAESKDIIIDESYFELMGYLVASSFIINKSIFVVLDNVEESNGVADRVVSLFKTVFDVSAKIALFKGCRYIAISVHNTELVKRISSEINKKVSDRKCPSRVWLATSTDKEAFITGIQNVYREKGLFFRILKNYRLAQEIRNLLLTLSYPCSINKIGKSTYEVRNTNKLTYHDDCFSFKITGIAREKYKGYVHNIEVDGDNSYVYLDTIVHNCDIRDPWVYDFEERSPARPYYNWVVMPTADSEPFDNNFISTLKGADAVLTYTDYGLNLLKKSGGGRLPLEGVAPPCSEDFMRHVVNKPGHKTMFGIPSDSFVIGTVMRNQRRKLFPEILEMFGKLLNKATVKEQKRMYLYFHTAWPDLGWDMPKILKEHGLGHKVYFSYYCHECNTLQPSLYQDIKSICRKCSKFSAVMPNTGRGLDRLDLAKVYNFFDLYLQYANSEGFGLSQIEAAYCGIPVLSTDYSAMAHIVRDIGGYPIPVKKFYREPEGHTYKALPDNDWTADKILELSRCDNYKEICHSHGKLARELYNWDKTAKVWMDVFDKLPPKDRWGRKFLDFKPDVSRLKDSMTDAEYVNAALLHVANRPDMTNTAFSANMVVWLMNKMVLTDVREDGRIVRKEQPFNRQSVINMCFDLYNKRENFERNRSLHNRK